MLIRQLMCSWDEPPEQSCVSTLFLVKCVSEGVPMRVARCLFVLGDRGVLGVKLVKSVWPEQTVSEVVCALEV